MPRFTDPDSDSERLPDGMYRVGYDADTQIYTFRDRHSGGYFEGPAGVRHPSHFTRVPSPSWPPVPADMRRALDDERAKSWRQENAPLLSFFLLVALFLLGVFWLMRHALGNAAATRAAVDLCGGREIHAVRAGDNCWDVAHTRGWVGVKELLEVNPGLDCDNLQVGRILCLPPLWSGKADMGAV